MQHKELLRVTRIQVIVRADTEDGSQSKLTFEMDPTNFEMIQSRRVTRSYGEGPLGSEESIGMDPQWGTRLKISGRIMPRRQWDAGASE